MSDKTDSAKLAELILAALENSPMNGYGIAREIESRSRDVLCYGEGSVYPALRKLERKGHVIGTWDAGRTGVTKKVYRLTGDGLGEVRRARVSLFENSRAVITGPAGF